MQYCHCHHIVPHNFYDVLLMYIPTRRDANIRDVDGNIRANDAFTLEANYSP